MSLFLFAALATAPAQEFRSETQEFMLADDLELFNSSEFSTGWVPAGSPLAVQFAIQSEGGASVSMEGYGDLTWPDALSLALHGEPGTGEILVDAELAAVTSLRFDVAGYSWEQELDRRGVIVEGEGEFDPLLLAGSPADRTTVDFVGNTTQLISYTIGVFSGVNLEFDVDLGPEAVTTFSGLYWWTEDGAVAQEGAPVEVAPSGLDVETTEATYVGRIQSDLALVFNPTFSVCVDLVGCWDLVDLDLPIPLASDDYEHEFAPTTLSFPLPVLGMPDEESVDLGEVLVGDTVNHQVQIENLGALALEGSAALLGSPFFISYPSTFLAAPYATDGVVVTFAPEEAGRFSATLVLESNDPLLPVTEVVVSGVAVDPDAEEQQEAGEPAEPQYKLISSEVGCGCGTSGQPAWPGLLGLLAGGVVMVRRRRDE